MNTPTITLPILNNPTGFSLRREGYSLKGNAQEKIGTKTYWKDTTGTETLPALGDPFDNDHDTCYFHRYSVGLIPADAGSSEFIQEWRLEYSTSADLESILGTSVALESLPHTYSFGYSGSGTSFTITLHIQKLFMSQGDITAMLTAYWFKRGAAAFEGFTPGVQLRFDQFDATSITMSDGSQRYRCSLGFTWRPSGSWIIYEAGTVDFNTLFKDY